MDQPGNSGTKLTSNSKFNLTEVTDITTHRKDQLQTAFYSVVCM